MLQSTLDLGELLTAAKERTVSASATVAQLCQDNPRRLAVIISADGVNALRVSFNANPAAGAGLLLAANTPPLCLSKSDFGDAVTRELWITAAGATTVTVWEVEDTGP